MSPPGHEVLGPVPAGQDPDEYDRRRRRVLWMLPTGLYVVGSHYQQRRNLMTISWVTQVALAPKLLGIGVESASVTHGLIAGGQVFALSILGREQRQLVRRYAKAVQDVDVAPDGTGLMQGAPVHVATTGAPILDVAVAWLDCEVRYQLDLGSHTWFVGEVVNCAQAETTADASTGADATGSAADDLHQVLRMEDTRMNYGG